MKKRILSLVLAILIVASMLSAQVFADGTYFPKYYGNTVSIVNALHAVGANYSYAYRAQIAAANGIEKYRGTAQQNIQMLEMLKDGKLIVPPAAPVTPPAKPEIVPGGYFPVYVGNTVSIVNALYAVGAQFSYAYRARIAEANGIVKYRGTAQQNIQMLEMLKAGKLIVPANPAPVEPPVITPGIYFPKYVGNTVSIVSALVSVGANWSYAYRAQIAAANGIVNYRGTADQNTTMLKLLKSGLLIKPV